MKQKRKQSPKEPSHQGTNSTSGSYIITTGSSTSAGSTGNIFTTTGVLPIYSGGTAYGNWTTVGYQELHIGNGKLIEENGDLIWVRPNGKKVNLTGKEAAFNKLYEVLKAPTTSKDVE